MDAELKSLEAKINQFVELCQRLRQDNQLLRQQLATAVVRRVVAIRDGRTSTEIHRRATTGDDGEVAHHAVEYAVLDRAGRLQLPREMTEPLGLRDLVRLEAEPDHIGVWPDRREPS